MVLGKRKVDAKSGEVTATPQLLKTLHLTDAIVTIDAMGYQKEIAKQIVHAQADYILALKSNQGGLYDDVKRFLDQVIDHGVSGANLEYYETLDKGHGRVEVRYYWITEAIDWLDSKAD